MALWVGFNSHVVSLTRRHRPHSPCLHMVAHVGCEDRVPNARTRRALSGLQMLNDRSEIPVPWVRTAERAADWARVAERRALGGCGSPNKTANQLIKVAL